ncbi:ADP-heptose:LPS heptosyltransferase [Mariniphaga anaerophila]|uniref:ADP-heptose:LPS heptosyltransferase n=1 Tax=Mariniphaga anaerophila TaxID=1484053 RepID=A0A1M5CJR4_9BACT|nr:glycosyltransferase family 9 protein [Mariniphaga anaerophila]SHF54994.1 ADP-heptose:LPS heptosyltransferase [Mariniphaga anaerophila]
MKIKFLVIRLSSIGDIVLTSPVVRCLKKQVEGAEVHFVTKKKYESLVSPNPYIDRVHTFSDSLSGLIHQLRQEKFDYIIDLHQNLRSNRIKSSLGVPSFSFQKLNIQKFLLVGLKINLLPENHIVDRNLETLSAFDVKNDEDGLDFFIPENEKFNVAELPEKHQKGYVAFVIGGTWATKKLPVEKVIEICNGISFPVVLLGGPDETGEAEVIVRETGNNVFNLTGKISLHQSASLLPGARVVLANDTGLMHIAAAFKKKILSFWGNTVPAFGMYPYQADPASEMLEVSGVKCRPCSKLGYRKCPRKHFRCMKEQDAAKAIAWIEKNFGD